MPRTFFWGVVVSLAAAALAPAQQVPFQLLFTQDGNAITVQNNSTLSFSALVGQAQTAQLRATYSGSGQVTVSQPPQLFGSPAFKVTLAGSLPRTLNPGESVAFDIEFAPSTSALSSAQLSQSFRESVTPAGGGTPTTTLNSINLNLQGRAPSFVLSYVLQVDQNVIPIQPGGAILFPDTLVNATSQAALNLTNTGSGEGSVTGIAITGAAFRIAGLPLLPANVPAGSNFQVLVLYKPVATGADTGEIKVTFGGAPPVTIALQGNGTSSKLTYEILRSGSLTPLAPGDTIGFGDATPGETTSVVVRVSNAGTASGSVTSVNSSGAAFQLSNVPILPQALAPGASTTFTVTFAPPQAGTLTGFLLVNSDSFNLSGTGLGSRLTFSYTSNGTTITIGPGNTSVVFSPVMISQSAEVLLRVKNTGTVPATISNIGVGQTGGPFSLTSQPALPFTVPANSEFQLTILFKPATLGFSNGTLQLDTTSVPLLGSGTEPPPLPSYALTGGGGVAPPGTQQNITLALSNPYPVAIAGTLTLGVSGELPDDPAVQFATGGRTVAFVIQANSTDAVFGGQGTRLGVQTGTVASSMLLTPAFATQVGNVNLTPKSPTTLQFSVAPAAPTVIAARVTNLTTNSFVITVTGFSTTRSLTNADLQFTAAPGITVPATQFTIGVQQVAAAWFGGTASRAFGGQFSMSIPISVRGTLDDGQPAVSGIASVAVKVANSVGSSNTVTLGVQ